MLVVVHVWIWMCNYLVNDKLCMSSSQLHIRLFFKYTTTAMTYGSVLITMLIEYVERYHVGFRRAVCTSTLILVHVWICMCHWLVYDTPWHHAWRHRNYSFVWCSTTMTITHDSAPMLIGYVERYLVGFGWPGRTLILVHVWIWVCHCLLLVCFFHDVKLIR